MGRIEKAEPLEVRGAFRFLLILSLILLSGVFYPYAPSPYPPIVSAGFLVLAFMAFYLPRAFQRGNCGKCSAPTCARFALRLLLGPKAGLRSCPYGYDPRPALLHISRTVGLALVLLALAVGKHLAFNLFTTLTMLALLLGTGAAVESYICRKAVLVVPRHVRWTSQLRGFLR
jgi:hypothetical protein